VRATLAAVVFYAAVSNHIAAARTQEQLFLLGNVDEAADDIDRKHSTKPAVHADELARQTIMAKPCAVGRAAMKRNTTDANIELAGCFDTCSVAIVPPMQCILLPFCDNRWKRVHLNRLK
jgi:hypothetical protein